MEPRRERKNRMHALAGGIVSGLVAGVGLWFWNALHNLWMRGVLWPTFKGASRPFFGDRAGSPGFELAPVIVGVLAHLAISAGWGLLFGLLFYGLSRAATVVAGLFWGVVVWFGMMYVVLPFAGLDFSAAARSRNVISQHLFFGLLLGLAFLPFQRRMTRRHAPAGRDVPITP